MAIVTDGKLTMWAERSASSYQNRGSSHSHGSDNSITWGNVSPEPGIVGTMHCSLHFRYFVDFQFVLY